jgi:hypothetical protein
MSRLDWMCAQYQAASRGSNRCAAWLGATGAAGIALLMWLAPGSQARAALLSVAALGGVVLVLAYCGTAVRRAVLVTRITEEAGEPGGIEYLDAHPSLLDFVACARPGTGGALARAAGSAGLVAAFLWFLYLWGYAVGLHWADRSPVLVLDAVTLIAAAVTTGPLTAGVRHRARV